MPEGFYKAYNSLMDEAMANLEHGQFKFFSFVYRKTIGWRKKWDKISYSQFQEQAKLSRSGVRAIRQELKKAGWIDFQKFNPENSNPYTIYTITKEECAKDQKGVAAKFINDKGGLSETPFEDERGSLKDPEGGHSRDPPSLLRQ